MVGLVWDNETERKYTTGVSKGVFFDGSGKGHAWSGLISVTEKPQTNEPTAIYNSLGQKYDQYGNVAEKKHGLSCYTYPEAMDEFLGYEYLEDVGFSVDERPPKKFHMAYRVELGNGLYEIHVLLNQIATFGETNRSTWSNNTSLSTITMNLTGAADPRYGTSHIVLDSRLPITESAEPILFGDPFNDSNINDFLEAEPTWETVAVNYAPIIEPDYDNYVWLGGENLLLDSGAGWSTDSYYMAPEGIPLRDSDIQEGETVTISLKGTLGSDRSDFSIFNSGGMLGLVSLSASDKGPDGVFRKTFKWRDTHATAPISNDNIRVYNVPREGTTVSSVEWVKIERGSVATPWTPAPSDPNQKPRPSDPYPENYKPGVKRASEWLNNRTVPYYDELRKGLGVYTYTHTLFSTQSRARIMSSNGLEGSNFRVRSEMYIESPPKFPTNGDPGIVVRYNRVETRPPRVSTSVKHHYLDYDVSKTTAANTPYLDVSFWHGGAGGSDPIIFINPMVTRNNDLDFFDANSKPKNKGERYVRVKGIQADYTLKQELRLRSKSRVRIYDQTYYDYWLEADDSQLIRQNETFTFSGPQAEITGDTFTIDDEILGSEGF